jgi:hypothetical protein
MRKLVFVVFVTAAGQILQVQEHPGIHGLPVATPDGQIAYVCETQARLYHVWEVDHYVQLEPCPEVPIQ